MKRSVGHWVSLGVAVWIASCSEELSPPDEVVQVTVDTIHGISKTITAKDTDTVVARFKISGDSLTGAAIRWTSSDPAKLELRAIPPSDTSRRAALKAQGSIQIIAHARGTFTVTATVEQPGIDTVAMLDSIKVLERWVSVSAGAGYACGLTVDSVAYCWGSTSVNTQQSGMGLGTGSSAGSKKPVAVLGGLEFGVITAGDLQTCGLTANTRLLYCWGRNLWGEVGNGTIADALIPQLVAGGRNFAQVSTSSGLTCGVTTADFLVGRRNSVLLPHNTLCWGRMSLGGLGHGARDLDSVFTLPCTTNRQQLFLCMPIPRDGVTQRDSFNIRLHSVSVGNGFACGIAKEVHGVAEGRAVCWGTNDVGQLGRHQRLGGAAGITCTDSLNLTKFDSVPCSFSPVFAAKGVEFTALSAGGPNTCGVSASQVYCWGGFYGDTLTHITAQNGIQLVIDSISVGGGHVGFSGSDAPLSDGSERPFACALTHDGQAYCWGDNVVGELGTGEDPTVGAIDHRGEMRKVSQDTLVFTAISAGARLEPFDTLHIAHACAVSQGGAIFCWGSNRSGGLGIADSSRALKPARIDEPYP